MLAASVMHRVALTLLFAPGFTHRAEFQHHVEVGSSGVAENDGDHGKPDKPKHYWKAAPVKDGYGNPYTYLYDLKTHLDCPVEYRLGDSFNQSAPDMAAEFGKWCDSKRVPEHLRVPEILRGFYWMKGNTKIGDVGFCTSLAEYDVERKEALLPPWATFMFWREPKTQYTWLAAKAAGMTSVKKQNSSHKSQTGYPYYRLQFDNDTLKSAKVKFSGMHRPLNAITRLPLIDAECVENTTICSSEPGDIWYRPTYIFGKLMHTYWSIRVYYDNGTLHNDRYQEMVKAEAGRGLIYERYTEKCEAWPNGRRPSRAEKKKIRDERKKQTGRQGGDTDGFDEFGEFDDGDAPSWRR